MSHFAFSPGSTGEVEESDKENASPQRSPSLCLPPELPKKKSQAMEFSLDHCDTSASEQDGGSIMHEELFYGDQNSTSQPSRLTGTRNSAISSTGGMVEDTTDDLFSEWRFELASHLSGKPQLLQRIVRLIERLEEENEELKNEKEHQKTRIKDLMNEANVMYERLTNGKAGGSAKKEDKKVFDMEDKKQAMSPTKKKSEEKETSTSKPKEEKKMKNPSFHFVSFLIGMFLSIVMMSAAFVFVDEDSLKILNGVITGENTTVPTGGQVDFATRRTSSSESSASSSEAPASAAPPAPTTAPDTSKCPEVQERITWFENQTNVLQAQLQEAQYAGVHAQASAAELQRQTHEMHQECSKVKNDMRILQLFVSRRGPVVDEPGKHCWAEWFTPEICCSPWYGPNGHPGCWSGDINYTNCCGFFSTKDTTSRYKFFEDRALPGPGDAAATSVK